MNYPLFKKLGWIPLIWFFIFLILPLLLVLVVSLQSRGPFGGIEWTWTLGNYSRSFQLVYFEIFVRSLALAGMTTVLCLFVGYPMAWAMATSSQKMRSLLLFLLALPFLMNLIIRVFSLRLLVGYDGPLQSALRHFEIAHNSFAFTQNQALVLVGMLTTYLPFMVFPLYAALEKFDYAQVEAIYDLGGGPWDAFFKVIVPGTRNALINGSLLVFIPAMGEFIIPDLLGGAKNMLIGNLITEQFLKARDWPFGAALSVLFVFSLLIIVWTVSRFGGPRGATKT